MNRLVYLNTTSDFSSPLSGRTPAGFDCKIDFFYRWGLDQIVTTDIAATLVLTGRTSNRSISYLVAATDVVNGKARALIPGGDLADVNGYDMTLVGTVDGMRKVIANGVLKLTQEGMPDVAAADVIDTVPLLLTRGIDASLTINLWADASKSVGYDLGSAVLAAAIYDVVGGSVLTPFTVTPIDADSVQMTIAAAVVDTLPSTCWWALTISAGGGVTTLAQGPVTVQAAP